MTNSAAILDRPQDTALEMLYKHYSDGKAVNMYPVDVFSIASKLGISILQNQYLNSDQAGLLVRNGPDSPVEIHLNQKDNQQRQRFTIAHELGHYAALKQAGHLESRFGFVEYRDELSSKGTDPAERSANAFAAELLMPEDAIRFWVNEGWDFEWVRNTLNVSKSALQNRYNHLGINY